MSHRQTLDTDGARPSLSRRVAAHAAVSAARLLAHLSPRQIQAVLRAVRRGAAPAPYATALATRHQVTAVSTLCAGRYCLQRSLATALLCRLGGTWPTWRTGVRVSPFAAHAWVEAEGRPVGEPEDTGTYHPMLTVEPLPRSAP
ncbi:lasso peptide biosynthesis B2 protein [Solihabitans fulvus]|uniref:Lasso peptide biosynthesis B2 protein n=1 Tax=Solihabitans fulvus TaxID=1892852 RepID=A0A5B2XTA4_9PSEU|nr:lasso peptide biosynthesis B2 protein [Solihabitans fulvus]KAA2267148.1 lasso peptide biosynthesis B2 protein [Solihabitans fulvus]